MNRQLLIYAATFSTAPLSPIARLPTIVSEPGGSRPQATLFLQNCPAANLRQTLSDYMMVPCLFLSSNLHKKDPDLASATNSC